MFATSMGTLCAIQSIAGHELFHRREWYHKMMGRWAFTIFLYSHFFDDHIYGHHKNVGTPEDAATAREGESLYHFIIRSVLGSHVNTWNRE